MRRMRAIVVGIRSGSPFSILLAQPSSLQCCDRHAGQQGYADGWLGTPPVFFSLLHLTLSDQVPFAVIPRQLAVI